MVFQAPRKFTKNFINDFLRKVEISYSWNEKLVPNIKIDLSEIREIDILGLLIIYKYIDYTHNKFCFKNAELYVDKYINNVWAEYAFDKLIQAYISNKEVTDVPFKEFKITVNERFIIAPQALLRNSNYTREYLHEEFIPKINAYYSKNPKVTDIIFTCFSEILLNFWEHAIEDTKSVIIADGNKNKIEIACADTGVGIISNLDALYKGTVKKENLLSKAVQKGVTSKPNTNHMGFGLWIVNELVKLNGGQLYLYSQGFYYHNNFGKIKTGKNPYWPGTIIYLNMNLDSPKTLSDLLKKSMDSTNIKVKFTQ